MNFRPETLESPTRARIRLRVAEAQGPARGVIQIHHGLAEHSGRYQRFALFLSERGFHVAVQDQRGHGETTAPDAQRGVFAARDGWSRVVADARAVEDHLRERFSGLPLILYGHSMGGVTAMTHAMARKGAVDGMAIWNSNLAMGSRAGLIRTVLALESLFKKPTDPSTWMEALTFKGWGKRIKNARTEFDWLSRLPEEVDAYIADPLAGWPASISMWRDLVEGTLRGEDEEALRLMPADLPIHLAAGGQDPVVDNGAAVKTLAARLHAARFTDVTMRFDPQGRHETLHDTGFDQAMADFAAWAERVCGRAG
ncbi:alpha/beta hydrolase [Alkalicaulis satelles]|uniref:Alpha/beta hydrolase n=1 Tax=Alkalicaulis satelles TaxID=2609175 RepID=A0A5M6ZC22_9PROT|nr:alpha/beta hydrolase [Alkalicaulis satelles]KAA5802262.1 alpha/beta hydrolase [Alkalicaulis satelles]